MKGRPHPLEACCRDVSHLLGRHPDLVERFHVHTGTSVHTQPLVASFCCTKTNFIEKEVAEGVKRLDLGICSFLPGH